MVNKILLILIFMICIAPFVVAESPYIVGNNANIVYAVRFSGGVVDDVKCNISIMSPQKNIMLSQFAPMTYNTNTKLHNYTLRGENISVDGDYCYTITCTYNEYNTTGYDCIEVTPSGKNATTAQSILYIFVLVMTFALFFLAVYGGFHIKGGNKRNAYNEVIAINWSKYLKSACWFIAFYLLYFSLYLTQNIATGLLNIPFVGRFFSLIILFFNVGIYVSIVLFAGWVLITFVADMKYRKMILGGIFKE